MPLQGRELLHCDDENLGHGVVQLRRPMVLTSTGVVLTGLRAQGGISPTHCESVYNGLMNINELDRTSIAEICGAKPTTIEQCQ